MSEISDKIKSTFSRLEDLIETPDFNGLNKESNNFDIYSYIDVKENYITTNSFLLRIYEGVRGYIESCEDIKHLSPIDNKLLFELNTFDDGVSVIAKDNDVSLINPSTNYMSSYAGEFVNYIETIQSKDTTSLLIDNYTFTIETFLKEYGLTITHNPNVYFFEKNTEVIVFLNEVNLILDVLGLSKVAESLKGLTILKSINKRSNEFVEGFSNSYKEKIIDGGILTENNYYLDRGTSYGYNNSARFSNQETGLTYKSSDSISTNDISLYRNLAHNDPSPPTDNFVPWNNNASFEFSLNTEKIESFIGFYPNSGTDLEITKTEITKIIDGGNSVMSGDKVLVNGVYSFLNRDISTYKNGIKLKIWLQQQQQEPRYYIERKIESILSPDTTGFDWEIPTTIKYTNYLTLAKEFNLDLTKNNLDLTFSELINIDYSPFLQSITADFLSASQNTTKTTDEGDVTIRRINKYRNFVSGFVQVRLSIESEYHNARFFFNLNELIESNPNAIIG